MMPMRASNESRAAMRRVPSGGAPFVLDWSRGTVYILDPRDDEWRDLIPATIYRARVGPETIVNAMQKRSRQGKPIRGAWSWTIIHVSPIAFHVDGGNAGTLAQAKRTAENAARPFAHGQQPIWEDSEDGSGTRAGGESDGGVPF